MQTTAAPPSRDARQRFHHYGPWVVGLIAVCAVLGYEIARHHLLSSDEIYFFIALVPSIILHEISHGVVAYWCGDDTAKRAGRLSLNPIRHIDPIGTLLLPALMILSPLHRAFGWAKPVPINLNNLRHPRNQAVLVGLVGPFTNALLALAGGFALRFATHNGATLPVVGAWPGWATFLYMFGYANAVLCAFNLIPIPPLDGSALLERLLPGRALPSYYRMRSFLMVAVIALVWLDTGVLAVLFNWALRLWADACFFA